MHTNVYSNNCPIPVKNPKTSTDKWKSKMPAHMKEYYSDRERHERLIYGTF